MSFLSTISLLSELQCIYFPQLLWDKVFWVHYGNVLWIVKSIVILNIVITYLPQIKKEKCKENEPALSLFKGPNVDTNPTLLPSQCHSSTWLWQGAGNLTHCGQSLHISNRWFPHPAALFWWFYRLPTYLCGEASGSAGLSPLDGLTAFSLWFRHVGFLTGTC